MFQTILAQNGVLDDSFGINGLKTVSIENKNLRGHFILTFSDNSFIVSGNFHESLYGSQINRSCFISKHNSDGNLDLTFGNNGFILIPNGPGGVSGITDMVKQADGKILISGAINGSPILMRIFENGNYDTSFGLNGIANISEFGKIGIQNNGKIIITTGFQNGDTCIYSFFRYLQNGVIDTSFGNNGTILTDVTSYAYDYCQGIKILPDNKFITFGNSSFHWGNYRNAVVCKFDENGILDNTFGNNGVTITSVGAAPGYSIFRDLEILDNGQIVTCGSSEYSGGTGGFGGSKPVIVKYNSNGTLDTTFGINGIVILNTIFNANDNFHSLTVQADGKILGLGNSAFPFPYVQSYLNITRLTDTGNIDLSFGNNGVFLTNNNNSESNGGWAIEMQNDNKILAVGYSKITNMRLLICRLNYDSFLNANDIISESNIIIYPNPSTSELYIKGIRRDSKVEVYNFLGQICDVIKKVIGTNEMKLDVSTLSKGTYILKIDDNSNILIKKIIVQ